MMRTSAGLTRPHSYAIITRTIALLLYCIVMVAFSACGENGAPVSKTDFLMGTYVSITVYDEAPATETRQAIERALQRMRALEKELNPYDDQSTIGRINKAAEEERKVTVSPELAALLRHSLSIANRTGGSFDPTTWPVFRLWGFDSDSASVPAPEKLQAALPSVDYRQVGIDQDNVLTLPPGVEIDASGISKGFAVEAAREELRKNGLENFVIDAGGNLGIEWRRSDPVSIHIRHPRKEGAFWGRFPIRNSCGIATSGDYFFSFEANGKRYHHVLDPASGYPAPQTVSSTVIAPDATTADGYSTAVFVMGPKRGAAFVEADSSLEAHLIYYDNTGRMQSYLSPGIQPHFTFLHDEAASSQ